MWEDDPYFRVQIWFFCQRSFCMFQWGCLGLTLVQIFCMRFCKENDSLVNLNEMKD
jgi:hypothetical protein